MEKTINQEHFLNSLFTLLDETFENTSLLYLPNKSGCGVLWTGAVRPPPLLFEKILSYIGWIKRAKRIETREKRLNQMLEELEKGNVCMKMARKAKS